jgi:hypothetical protein
MEARSKQYKTVPTPTYRTLSRVPDRPDSTIRFRRLGSWAGRRGRLHALPIHYACMLHCTSPLLETAAAAGMARSEGGSSTEELGRWPT